MKKILVIEKDEALLSLLWYALEPDEAQVIVVDSGWVGLQIAQTERPDLIVCGVELPGLDGYEVLQAVRGSAAIAPTPFILLSNRTDLESRCMAIALGVDDFLTQPITLEQLTIAIAVQLSPQPRFAAPARIQAMSLFSSGED